MDYGRLEEVTQQLVRSGKGLLALDQGNASYEKCFASVDIACTESTRREYRELLLSTPGIEALISGVTMDDEAFWQSTAKGQVFREYLKTAGILPGIKVDKGLIALPGFPAEKITQGLDSLPQEVDIYEGAGVRFAKWRAAITITEDLPTDEGIGANTFLLSRYARICQEEGIVPIVEIGILFEEAEAHSIERTEHVMAHALDVLFMTLRAFRVHLPGAILQTSMVLPGKDNSATVETDDIAERTLRLLSEHVPQELGGVVLASDAQTSSNTCRIFNAIAKRGPFPWGLSFAYSCTQQQDTVLEAWAKDRRNVKQAQDAFYRQLQLVSAASKGELDEPLVR